METFHLGVLDGDYYMAFLIFEVVVHACGESTTIKYILSSPHSKKDYVDPPVVCLGI